MGNPDTIASRFFAYAVRSDSLGLRRDWFSTQHGASDCIIICSVHSSLTPCRNADGQDEQEASDACCRYGGGSMYGDDTDSVAFRETGAVASLSGELHYRDSADIPAACK